MKLLWNDESGRELTPFPGASPLQTAPGRIWRQKDDGEWWLVRLAWGHRCPTEIPEYIQQKEKSLRERWDEKEAGGREEMWYSKAGETTVLLCKHDVMIRSNLITVYVDIKSIGCPGT